MCGRRVVLSKVMGPARFRNEDKITLNVSSQTPEMLRYAQAHRLYRLFYSVLIQQPPASETSLLDAVIGREIKLNCNAQDIRCLLKALEMMAGRLAGHADEERKVFLKNLTAEGGGGRIKLKADNDRYLPFVSFNEVWPYKDIDQVFTSRGWILKVLPRLRKELKLKVSANLDDDDDDDGDTETEFWWPECELFVGISEQLDEYISVKNGYERSEFLSHPDQTKRELMERFDRRELVLLLTAVNNALDIFSKQVNDEERYMSPGKVVVIEPGQVLRVKPLLVKLPLRKLEISVWDWIKYDVYLRNMSFIISACLKEKNSAAEGDIASCLTNENQNETGAKSKGGGEEEEASKALRQTKKTAASKKSSD